MDKNIAPFVAANQVKVMDKPSLADAAQATLAVPDYVAAAGLKTFADIARFKDQLGGKIYGIEPGSGANTTIKTMIETNHFGLDDFKLIESGEAGMMAAVQRAVNRQGVRGIRRLDPAPDEHQHEDRLPDRQRRRVRRTKVRRQCPPSPPRITPSAA